MPDGPPPSARHVSDALQAAFDASDVSVATIGDIVRATAAAAPRDCAGVDPQFLSTLALDSIQESMMRTVVACVASMTADASAGAQAGRKRSKPS